MGRYFSSSRLIRALMRIVHAVDEYTQTVAVNAAYVAELEAARSRLEEMVRAARARAGSRSTR